MSNMTNSLNSMSAQKDNITQDDITYVDVQIQNDTTANETTNTEEVLPQSDITITQENIEAAPKTEQLAEETPKEDVQQNTIQPTPAPLKEKKT